MSRNKKEIPNWAKSGHRKPVTRREFLAHGIIPFAAAAFMPNWMKLLSPEMAMAQASCANPVSGMVPFIQLNLEGGAGLAANYVPMDEGRQLLPSYNIMGLGNNQFPITRVFNNAPFAGNGISNILTGIQAQAQTATLNNTAFIGFCTRTGDDTMSNFLGVAGLIHRAGLVGTKFPPLGHRDTASGIGQTPAIFAPPSPLVVGSFNDIANSLGYTAGLAGLNQTQKEKLTKLVADLNNSQARKLASINSGPQIQQLLNCVGVKNQQLIQEGTSAIDPRLNAEVAAVWGLNANSPANSESFVFGSMTYNTLLGHSGSASFGKGGYDYHNNDRATVTNVRDREAGVVIGRVLETARVLNKPVFLMVTTDGGVGAERSETPLSSYNGDRGSASMIYTFLYHPNGRPGTTDFQVGHYMDQQAADVNFVTGNNSELAAQAVFLNWLKMNNKMDLYSQIIPAQRAMDASKIAQVVKVA